MQRCCVLPGIYAHDRLPLDRLRQKLPALAEADDVYTNHIHAEDLARIAIATLVRGSSTRVYNTVDDSRLKMGSTSTSCRRRRPAASAAPATRAAEGRGCHR